MRDQCPMHPRQHCTASAALCSQHEAVTRSQRLCMETYCRLVLAQEPDTEEAGASVRLRGECVNNES